MGASSSEVLQCTEFTFIIVTSANGFLRLLVIPMKRQGLRLTGYSATGSGQRFDNLRGLDEGDRMDTQSQTSDRHGKDTLESLKKRLRSLEEEVGLTDELYYIQSDIETLEKRIAEMEQPSNDR